METYFLEAIKQRTKSHLTANRTFIHTVKERIKPFVQMQWERRETEESRPPSKLQNKLDCWRKEDLVGESCLGQTGLVPTRTGLFSIQTYPSPSQVYSTSPSSERGNLWPWAVTPHSGQVGRQLRVHSARMSTLSNTQPWAGGK